MMKISKKIWISIALVFGMVWHMGNFYAALDYVILIYGDLYFITDVSLVYMRLKDVHFNFRKAATTREWTRFLISSVVIWLLFFSLRSEFAFLLAILFFFFLLPGLLIYDICATYIRKLFN